MYVGGSVWALDWCPRVLERPDSHSKCEFIAVATHAPASYYHQVGAPLTGRGIIQIWCVLNVGIEDIRFWNIEGRIQETILIVFNRECYVLYTITMVYSFTIAV
ncbi:hypothetical protein Pint_05060 [Pistacia integerrima]|uniref:Uncharacterized protein n=1 Tax=Pistacia integerrima TaxID=434235 RepID=A0ACC0Z789_9ROSI|nr:hypothetical protein Pint_05060 [Pistacia integerrima]